MLDRFGGSTPFKLMGIALKFLKYIRLTNVWEMVRARNIPHTETSAGRPCKITFFAVVEKYIRITKQ